ncbi:MAG: hypothetical protein OXC37_01415 [Bdellovibrionaceae bacterium]|nr:hypothetical protein [Pseudobdellovibrionaceae bacterium]
MPKWLFSILIFVVIFGMGLIIGLISWNSNLYVSWIPSTKRTLAMAGNQSNLLNLSSDSLTEDPSSVLFSQYEIFQENNFLSFYLGNILIPDPKTQTHRFICEVFPIVEFSFSALGVNLSGEKGVMLVQSPCETEDIDWIGPFWLPQNEILSHPEKNTFQIEEKDTFIRFYNASIELTPSWLLSSVRFFDKEKESEELLIRLKANQKPYFEIDLNLTYESFSENNISD